MTDDLDVTACAREPIHIPGSIQPHGVLLGLIEPKLEISNASENAAALLGVSGSLLGRELASLIDRSSLAELRTALGDDPRHANPLAMRLANGVAMHGLAHRSDGLLVLELEPAGDDESRFRTAYRRLVRRFEQLRRAATLDEVCALAAREVQTLSGFDRVMVYRFEPDGSGSVVAERRADETMQSYLGLHYPAADIPPQARRLYIVNPLRLIVDAAYAPVPLLPATNPLTSAPLDLTHSTLRSVSPVHCEYLRNMGVAASMSISLLHGDELWGLIACHHRSPYHVPYATRLAAEFLAHVLSARILELDRTEALTRKTAAYRIQADLINEMVAAPRFQEGLQGSGTRLDSLLDCDGAAILYRGETTRIGETPRDEQIRELGADLAANYAGQVVATDHLSALHAPAAQYVDCAAGLIAVPISADGADFLFWFRAERLRSVTWAGEPVNATATSNGGRLRPRASFEAWTEEVRGRAQPWADWEVEVATDFRTALVASIIHQATELERLNAKLLQASRTKDEFLAAVSHELRNPLNAILGWARIARTGVQGEELSKALATIERNAVAQTQLIDDLLDVGRIETGRLQLETRVLDLGELIEQALETVEPTARARDIEIRTRIDRKGADVVGDPRRLQQVVWNLLTNAIKFSADGEGIDVELQRGDSQLALTVRDRGIGIDADLLPHIFEPFRQGESRAKRAGLGLGLSIVRSIVELHGGRIVAVSEGAGRGSLFTVRLPVAALTADGVDEPRRAGTDVDLEGVDIVVAEDNPEAAEMVATLLRNHGASVRVASDGSQALQQLRDRQPDLVISDLDMPEMDGFALIGAILDDQELQPVPAIALTAFARGGDRARALSAGFRHHVAKPVDPEELIAVAASALGLLLPRR